MSTVNRQFRIAARPVGMVKEAISNTPKQRSPTSPTARRAIRTTYLSLDPSMRGQMENRADYVAPLAIGDVMRAGGVGVIDASKNRDLPIGALVAGSLGMQDYCVTDGKSLPVRVYPDRHRSDRGARRTRRHRHDRVLRPARSRRTEAGADRRRQRRGRRNRQHRGTNRAHQRLPRRRARRRRDEMRVAHRRTRLRRGDRLQIARTSARALDAACPNGINIYFDNVGGEILDLCLARIAMNARVVICGGISRYNAQGPIPGPRNYFNLVFRRARMEGFIVLDYAKRFPEASRQMQQWIDSGELKHRATVVEGFRNLPKALIQLFQGENIGKMMVKV